MKAFWWTGTPNFGDALTPLLLQRISGKTAEWSTILFADIVVVGSVLHQIPEGWWGIVAGAGKLFETTEPKLQHADVRLLRGPLSAAGIKGDFALGDPGLLASEIVTAEPGKYDLGVVPHWSDNELASRFKKWNPRVISPRQDPETVVREIGSCKKIVSSSLHGLIVADSFGIPRRAEMFHRAQYEGLDFKFNDYGASIGVPTEFGKLQQPHSWRIEARQREIFDVLEAL